MKKLDQRSGIMKLTNLLKSFGRNLLDWLDASTFHVEPGPDRAHAFLPAIALKNVCLT